MNAPSGPQSCPLEVMDLILVRVDRKDLRSYSICSRAFRRHAARLLLQHVSISRPSHIHALYAFIHSDQHGVSASCIRHLSFRALSFTSGLTKGQDYHAFIEPLLGILAGASNIEILAFEDTDTFLSTCTPLIGAFAALPNVKELRVEMIMNEINNIQQIIQAFHSFPTRVSLNLSTQACHHNAFYLLDSPSMANVTELHVANMHMDNTEQFPNEKIKVMLSMRTLISKVTHYGFIIFSRERALRRALRSADMNNLLTRFPNVHCLYLFGYDRFYCDTAPSVHADRDSWRTMDVLGSDFQALAEAKPPLKVASLDIAHFKFHDVDVDDRSADKYIPAILERHRPSRLRLKFALSGFHQGIHRGHTPIKTFIPENTHFSHLWLFIDPYHLHYESHESVMKRMRDYGYSFLREVVDIIARTECTRLVLHLAIEADEELQLGNCIPADLLFVASLIAELMLERGRRGLECLSILAGPLGHGAWRINYTVERRWELEELDDPEQFERDFLDECGFLDI